MTTIQRPFVAGTMILFSWLAGANLAAATGQVFRAGAHAIDISPTVFPVNIIGGFIQKQADRMVDRLHARCLVLDDGTTRLAIVVVDSCMLPRELVDKAKALASASTGIPVERMLVAATHTHSAPAGMGGLGTNVDERYAEWLSGRIADGITLAAKNLAPARVGWTVVDDWQHTFNRRWITRPDKMRTDPFGVQSVRAMMHPGYENPDYTGPSGPVDPGLSLLAVQSLDGRPVALLANYSQHYFGAAPVSADYFGKFAEGIGKRVGAREGEPAFVGIMSQGTSGDLMWMDYSRPKKNTSSDKYTEELLQVAAAAHGKIQYRDFASLAMAEARLTLRRRVADSSRLEWAQKTMAEVGDRVPANRTEVYAREQVLIAAEPQRELKLQAVRVGDFGITALPNEVFAITGLKLKAQSPLQPTMNIELANGSEGYIPPPEQHKLGGYTAWAARTAGLEPQAEPQIVETVLGLLEKVAGKPRRQLIDTHGAYGEAVLSAKPVVYWRLNEIVPGKARDAAGYGRTATYEDGVAMYLPGAQSQADAISDEPEKPSVFSGPEINRAPMFAGGRIHGKLPQVKQQYSAEFWFWNGMPADLRPVTGYLFSRGTPADRAAAGDHLGIGGTHEGGGRADKLFFFNGNQVHTTIAGSTRLGLRQWHHVVLVRNQRRVTIYLDGRLEAMGEADFTVPEGVGSLFLGGRCDNFANFEGKLDEVAVYDRMLTPAEVEQHFELSGRKPATAASASPRVVEDATSSSPAALLDELLALRDSASPWQPLFNGNDLSGFHTHLAGLGRNNDPDRIFQVDQGVIHLFKDVPVGSRSMPFGGFITDKDYSDYHLRFEFKWGQNKYPPRAKTVRDAGLLYHVHGETDDSYNPSWGRSLELQIQEGDVGDFYAVGTKASTLVDKSRNASLRNGTPVVIGQSAEQVARCTKEFNAERDGWNTIELIARGDAAVHFVNGKPVHFVFNAQCSIAGQWQPLTKGRLWFQAEGAEILYRNIELRSLPPAKKATDATKPSLSVQSPPISPVDSLKKIRVPKGFQVELVAAEPQVLDPVAFDWDSRGRLWVIEMADYPLGMDGQGKPGGRVRLLEDRDGDGRYETSRLFADGLSFPNGILTWRDGVLVTAAPDILFLRDTNDDGRVDVREVIFHGFNEGNQQLRVNGLRWGLDNRVCCANGGHHANYGKDTLIVSQRTGKKYELGSRDFSFDPDTGDLTLESGPTQFGRNRDPWGHWFGTQNANPLWQYVLPDRYLQRNQYVPAASPIKYVLGAGSPLVYPASAQEKRYHSFQQAGRFTSACAGMIYGDDRLFGDGPALHAFVCEPFHNLVQHQVLADAGVSFAAQRAKGEEHFDFFASEDRWCRPVMVRTGPDGALWVADMYRYMIEHPQFLPQAGKDELMPHYRLGDDRGRIYRVTNTNSSIAKPARLDRLDTAGLVAALDSGNAWQRDKVQQMLLWKRDASAVPLLEHLAASSPRPATRLQAFCTLDGLTALQARHVLRALADEHPRVRENALRLAEPHATPEVIAAAAQLVNDRDAKVRLQLAFSLGQWQGDTPAKALATLAVQNADDDFLVAAVMSSAVPFTRLLSEAVLQSEPRVVERYSELLLRQSLGMADTDAVAALLLESLTSKRGDPARNFSRMLLTLERAGGSWEKLQASRDQPSVVALVQEARELFERASVLVSDQNATADARLAVAELLCRSREHRTAGVAVLAAFLKPQYTIEIQSQAVATLAQSEADGVPSLLAQAWPELSVTMRERVLDAWLSRRAWTEDLLGRLETREIVAASIDPAHRDRLTRYPVKMVAARAAKILNTAGDPSRAKVIEEYRSALALTGDAERGKQIYGRTCVACHKRGQEGRDIGPNLATVTSHAPEKLLVNILDPNADIQPGYQVYTCVLVSGETLSGLLAAETANSLSIKQADGSIRTVTRREVDMLYNSSRSLMPEGLEKLLQPQDVADLISFLRTPLL